MSAPSNQPKSVSTFRTSLVGCVCILVMTAVVIAFAPSYQAGVDGREVAMGSDFLQEWIGAKIISRGEMDRLYDWQYSKSLQHDPDLVGFDWPKSQYYPMVYPPFYYWLLQPLSWISCLAAARLWCVLNGLAIAAAAWLLSRELSSFSKAAKYAPFIMLSFSPILLSLNMGQKSGFLCLIFTACLVLLRKSRSLEAGFVFGFVLFKPQLAIILLLAMLLRRDWRFLLGFAATGSLFGIVTLLHGLQPLWEFVSVVRGAGSYMDSVGYQIEDAHNLWCVIRNAMSFGSPLAVRLVFASFAAILLLAVARGTLNSGNADDDRSPQLLDQFSLWVVASLLLSPHLLTYDLSLLVIPMCIELVRQGQFNKSMHPSAIANWGPYVAALLYFGSWWSVHLAELANVQVTTPLMMVWCLSLSYRLLGHSLFALRRNPDSENFNDAAQIAAIAR